MVDGAIATALIGIFTAVCTPVFVYFQAQLKELKSDRDKDREKIARLQEEVAHCHEERLADRIWRAKWESTIEAIVGGSSVDDTVPMIQKIRERVKADRAERKRQENESTEGDG